MSHSVYDLLHSCHFENSLCSHMHGLNAVCFIHMVDVFHM